MRARRSEVREPEAFLRRTVTRLCLEQLKSARRQREVYAGPWLPEPVVEEADEEEDVTLPLMLALERLSPLERAAFPLDDVFGVGFEEIADNGPTQPGRLPAARRPGAERTSARPARGSGSRSSAASRSPTPSSPPRGAATWPGARRHARRRCQPACRRRRQAARRIAADPRLRRGDAGARVAGRAVPQAGLYSGAHRLHQRPAGLRDPGGRWRARGRPPSRSRTGRSRRST